MAFPTGLALVNAILCILIIGGALAILKWLAPKVRIVMFGTIAISSIILYHILSTPSTSEPGFSVAAELMAVLILICCLLIGYFFELTSK